MSTSQGQKGSWLSNQPLTTKGLGIIAGGVVAAMAGLGTVHSVFVVPLILNECRAVIREEIDRHRSQGPHPGGVRGELLDARLREIEFRLGRIEDKLDDKKEGS